jgi:hypothetical protein
VNSSIGSGKYRTTSYYSTDVILAFSSFFSLNFDLVKKIFSILFLSALLLQVAGSYVYFIARLAGIRSEMREQLKYKPDEELTVFTLTPDEFLKIKVDDQEVKVDGKMYDIARIEKKGDKLVVYALHDEAEDNLLAFLSEMASRTSKDKKPVPSQLVKLITLQFVFSEINLPVRTNYFTFHNSIYTEHESNFVQLIESPPPRAC